MKSTFRRPIRVVAATVTAVLATPLLIAASSPAQPPAPPAVVQGQLADKTPYRFLVPADWNGTVFVDLDFAGSSQVSGTVQHLVASGAAYGGTSRSVTSWDIH